MTAIRVSDLVPAGETIRYTAGHPDAFNGGFTAIVLKDGKVLPQDTNVAESFYGVSKALKIGQENFSVYTNFMNLRHAMRNWFYGDTPLVDLYDEIIEDLEQIAA